MKTLFTKLISDEAGFIVSAELILVSTIAVLSMVVGLSEVAHAVNQELEDVASAFGATNQYVEYSGTSGHQGSVSGSCFHDTEDFCDGSNDIAATSPQAEGNALGGDNYDW